MSAEERDKVEPTKREILIVNDHVVFAGLLTYLAGLGFLACGLVGVLAITVLWYSH
jgi:hypothetical protein